MKKIVSPEVTTMSVCPDCGAHTRAGRHLDIDCNTIKEHRAERDEAVKLLRTAHLYVDCGQDLHKEYRGFLKRIDEKEPVGDNH
jgi:hypothetical protein